MDKSIISLGYNSPNKYPRLATALRHRQVGGIIFLSVLGANVIRVLLILVQMALALSFFARKASALFAFGADEGVVDDPLELAVDRTEFVGGPALEHLHGGRIESE